MALTGGDDFDVTEVNIASLSLSRADGVGGSISPNEGPPGPHTTVEDVATGICEGQAPEGACCLGPNDCIETTESDCAAQGGLFNVDIACASGICDAPECEGADCDTFIPCQDDPGCVCVTTPTGGGVCVISSTPCAGLELCPDGTCPPGSVCALDTCCGDPVCVPQEAFCADAPAPAGDPPAGTRTIADPGTSVVGQFSGPVAEVAGGEPECECTEDGADGVADLLMHFATQAMAEILELNQVQGGTEVELCVSGQLNDGTPFEACDCMLIVPPHANAVVSANAGVFIDLSPPDLFGNAGGAGGLVRWYQPNTPITATAPPALPGDPLLNRKFDHWIVDGVAQPVGQRTITAVVGSWNQPADLRAIYGPMVPNVDGLGRVASD